MLPKSYLKVIAASIVFESKLSKTAKTQLIRFIESDASDLQLKVFINTGEIKKRSDIDEDVKLENDGALSMVVAAALAAGKKAQNVFRTAAQKACADKKGGQKDICIAVYKAKAAQAKVAALKRDMAKCDKTANAKKCRNTFMKYIKKYEKRS